MTVDEAAPETGKQWSDTGTRRDRRGLKHRAVGETRRVPVPPALVALLRAHLDRFGSDVDGRLFTGQQGAPLAGVTYTRLWARARKTALTPEQHASPLARRPYDLRHTAVSPGSTVASAPRALPNGLATASTCCSRSTPSAWTVRRMPTCVVSMPAKREVMDSQEPGHLNRRRQAMGSSLPGLSWEGRSVTTQGSIGVLGQPCSKPFSGVDAVEVVSAQFEASRTGSCTALGSAVLLLTTLRAMSGLSVLNVSYLEHARRVAAGVGAVQDRDALDVLTRMPHGVEIASRSFSSRERRLLSLVGPGVVGRRRGFFTRVAAPPVVVELMVIADTQWARGLARVSRLGPYCARVLVLPRLPRDSVELLLEAHYLGVGVAAGADPVVVPAAPFTPARYTAASWAFAESAYAQFRGQSEDHALSTAGQGS